jgi:hypothetical protein
VGALGEAACGVRDGALGATVGTTATIVGVGALMSGAVVGEASASAPAAGVDVGATGEAANSSEVGGIVGDGPAVAVRVGKAFARSVATLRAARSVLCASG